MDPNPSQPATLRQWSLSTLWVSTVVAVAAGAVVVWWDLDSPIRFGLGVSGGLVVVAATTGWLMRPLAELSITLPTVLTLTRGAALAVFGGFLATGVADGSLTWLPAALFGFAAGVDAVDGALARATDSVSALGARLDTETDGLAVLFGTVAVVAAAVVPAAFLIVGVARYAFVVGIWQRKRRGLPVYELPPSQLRRLLGATAMVTIWIALLPVVPAAVSRPLAALVVVPFVINFTLDWLAVSGRR